MVNKVAFLLITDEKLSFVFKLLAAAVNNM